MDSDQVAVTAAYLEHLTDGDVALLLSEAVDVPRARPESERRTVLRQRRGGIDDLLASPRVFETVFRGDHAVEPLVGVSPFLAFAVAVHRAALELGSATYAEEWVGIGRRTPVFDVPHLREFLSAPWHRFFLAELLASYTHVASGSVLVATRRGLRRQRFSELDPVRLASLLDVVPPAERPGVLRRLGDLALFLTGVFPDYVARRGFAPIEQSRLARVSRSAFARERTEPTREQRPLGPGDGDAVALLEQLGRRSYHAAFQLIGTPVSGHVAILGELPQRFGDARRILGIVTERFLFANRDRWFGLGSA
jgi:hypothetical protein